MAAGLPILANQTSFVGDIVRAAGCGKTFDFSRTSLLVSNINDLAANPDIRYDLGRRGYNYFLKEFNWNIASLEFYQEIEGRIRHSQPETMSIFGAQDDPYMIPSLAAEAPAVLSKFVAKQWSSLYSVICWIIKSVWHLLPFGLRSRFYPILRRYLMKLRAF